MSIRKQWEKALKNYYKGKPKKHFNLTRRQKIKLIKIKLKKVYSNPEYGLVNDVKCVVDKLYKIYNYIDYRHFYRCWQENWEYLYW